MADAAVTEMAMRETKKVMNNLRATDALAGFRGSSGPSQPTRIRESFSAIACADGPFSASTSFE